MIRLRKPASQTQTKTARTSRSALVPFVLAGSVLSLLALFAGLATNETLAQRRGRNWDHTQPPPDRHGVPDWKLDNRFKHDCFTFVRLKYNSYRGWGRWATDYPDSDLNFSYRLQQLTSMKVDPNGKIVEITDPQLFDYPWVYMIEPGGLQFTEEEATTLRRYLFNGGFMMVDDFWGEDEWYNFYTQIKRVFPDREPMALPPDHPIFHCVYSLPEKPQIPSIGIAQRGRFSGITYERPDAKEVHYKGIFDDEGRMMVIICHNTDLGDGWEREGEDPWYFKEFSEKKAYPLGINIVFYAMTH